jgi:hypothetical protein
MPSQIFDEMLQALEYGNTQNTLRIKIRLFEM